jgi:hypothetical protein
VSIAFWVYRFGTKSSHHFHCSCSSTDKLANLLFGCKDSVPNLLIASSIAAAALPLELHNEVLLKPLKAPLVSKDPEDLLWVFMTANY